MTEHETIQREVFDACKRGDHSRCESWREGYVDGAMRRAGVQCSCSCHVKSRPDEP